MTPEGRVKASIKRLLKAYKHGMYWNMPVPAGYGVPMLDFVGCFHGQFFAIEAKAPGKKPTRRQAAVIEEMTAAGGAVFVIDGDTTLGEFERWLQHVERSGKPRA